jgi:uncharacterized protein YcbK (DUF882 family)
MDRRQLLALVAGTMIMPGTLRAMLTAPPLLRRLRLVNPHTNETFEGRYRDENGPLVSAMAELSVFLRDFHSDTAVPIDIGVVDFLASIISAIGADSAVILSAYRTPETNAMLARTTFGVAENSQHLYGRALDVHFPTRLYEAMLAARQMEYGGVGWYPNSRFMHIDTGPVRNWDLDEAGLGSLLWDGRRVHLNGRGEPLRGEGHDLPGMEQSGRVLPHLKQSGQILPQVQSRGGIRPEWGQSGRILPQIRGSGRPL